MSSYEIEFILSVTLSNLQREDSCNCHMHRISHTIESYLHRCPICPRFPFKNIPALANKLQEFNNSNIIDHRDVLSTFTSIDVKIFLRHPRRSPLRAMDYIDILTYCKQANYVDRAEIIFRCPLDIQTELVNCSRVLIREVLLEFSEKYPAVVAGIRARDKIPSFVNYNKIAAEFPCLELPAMQ